MNNKHTIFGSMNNEPNDPNGATTARVHGPEDSRRDSGVFPNM